MIRSSRAHVRAVRSLGVGPPALLMAEAIPRLEQVAVLGRRVGGERNHVAAEGAVEIHALDVVARGRTVGSRRRRADGCLAVRETGRRAAARRPEPTNYSEIEIRFKL
jgi:hypothetical protein